MSRPQATVALILMVGAASHAQTRRLEQDSSLNNLIHPPGYQTCALGELGRVTQVGTGPREMILIAGAGFDGAVYDTFMASWKDRFTMYAVTLPGFGGTAAPPMPPEGTSYGDQTWTRGAQQGVERLMAEHKMQKPVLVGHWWIATQIALQIALDHPDEVGAVILISGIANNSAADKQYGRSLSVDERIRSVDQGMAPQWFKTVTHDTWYDNNWYPYHFAKHPVRALQLWRMTYEPTLPVWIRYTCEGWAQDVTERLDQLQVPTLIIKPGFDKAYFDIPGLRNATQSYLLDSWNGVESMSDKITVQTIDDTRAFIMDDQPEQLDRVIGAFLSKALDGC